MSVHDTHVVVNLLLFLCCWFHQWQQVCRSLTGLAGRTLDSLCAGRGPPPPDYQTKRCAECQWVWIGLHSMPTGSMFRRCPRFRQLSM